MAFRRAASGRPLAMKVLVVMALVAVDLLHGLSVDVLLVFRSSMAVLAVQLPFVHRASEVFHRYTKPALPARLAVAPDAVLRLIGKDRGNSSGKCEQY
jgi:hypothetical protein